VRRAAPFLLAFAAVAGLAFADGGYEPPSWNVATAALACVLTVALALRVVAASLLELAAVAGLAALALWAALSTAWSVAVPLSALDAQRLLVLPVALAAFTAVGPGRGTLEGVALAATAASVWNLVTRVGAGEDSGANALPLGYANALALLAGMGLLLALGLAREQPLWLLACVPLAAVVLASESRGAVLALALGALVVVALRRGRGLVAVVAGGAIVLTAGAVAFSNERPAYWAVALDAASERPLLGSGAGTWVRSWLAERDDAFPARDAHGLYVETLAELGPLGLALVALALALPLAAAARAREEPYVPIAGGAYATFVLHAGIDWDLELAAVAVAGIACGSYLLAAAPARRVRVPPRAAVGVVAVGLVGIALLPGNLSLELAREALRSGDPAEGESRASRAARLAPWSAEAWRLRGEAQRELGDPAAAADSFREGLERDAGDVELWLALARVEEGEGRRRALERARRLNPLGVAP
jgi:O-antigen ligase